MQTLQYKPFRHVSHKNASKSFLFFGKCAEFEFIANKGFVQVPFTSQAGLRHCLHVEHDGFVHAGEVHSLHFLVSSVYSLCCILSLNAVLSLYSSQMLHLRRAQVGHVHFPVVLKHSACFALGLPAGHSALAHLGY